MQKPAIDSKNFIFILVVLFILIAMNGQGRLEGPKNVALSWLAPIGARFQSSSNTLADFLNTVEKIDTFKSENERLQAENRDLNYKLVTSEEVRLENETLRKQLKFRSGLCGESDCIEFRIGNITGRTLDSYGKFIMTDLGESDGAAVGNAITIGGGIMIGKIVEVDGEYSKVMLLTSPESSVNCLTEVTRANGLLRGKYGTGVMLEMIDQSEGLDKDDIVITSGLETGIPKGLILGRISLVEESPNTVFKSAEVGLFSDFDHIEQIFLVKQNEG